MSVLSGMFAVVLQLASLGIVVLFGVVLLRRRRGPVRPAPTAPGVLSWQAHLFAPQDQFSPAAQWGSARYGRLELSGAGPSAAGPSGAELAWYGDGGEVWRTPVRAVALRGVHGAGFLAGQPSVDLEIAGAGEYRVVVSDRPINRFMANDFKRLREADTARELAGALLARGATDLSRR